MLGLERIMLRVYSMIVTASYDTTKMDKYWRDFRLIFSGFWGLWCSRFAPSFIRVICRSLSNCGELSDVSCIGFDLVWDLE